MKTSKTLSPKQKKIAQMAGDPNKIEGEDFKKLKPMKASEGTFAKRAKKLKEDVDSEFVERAGKLKMGKKMGGSAIKAKDGVEIETSKRKNLREAAKGARAGGASEATLKYFLDNANRSNERPTAKTMKYFLDNANKPRDRLTERDFKMINDRFASRDREEALDKGFSDAEISAMGKKAGGAAIKGKGAVARDRGMGLQDENISVGKGADYIKDLIS
jgi:hypothetical protein